MKKKNQTHEIDKIITRFLQAKDEGSFGSKDKIFLFKELSYLLSGGVGIMAAFELIYQSTDNFAVKTIAKTISGYINQWKTLSYALSRLPDYFDEWDIHIIKTWEKSGNLPTILKSLSMEYGYINTIKNKYIGALIYPWILVIVAIVAVIGLFAFILPEIFKVIANFPNVNIPMSTRILKNISDFIIGQRKILISVSMVIILFVSAFLSTRTGKRLFLNILMEVPLIGKMSKFFYLIKRCRYMKVMLTSGMSYVETFLLLRDILNIPLYQDMIERILSWLQKWQNIYNTLKYEHKLIPANAATLIKVWEESANLWKSIQNILDIYSEELDSYIDRLSKIIEPIMLIFIWGIVVMIALWVFGLIFQVMDGAGL